MSNHQSSSTALFNDIYRSLDKVRSKKMQDTRVETKNIQSRNSLVRDGNSKVGETEDQRRTCLIDDWMEKKRIHTRPVPPLDSSYASSSHSTSPAFSSSGSESLRPAKNRDSCLPPFKPKQIRTTTVHSQISKPNQSSLSLERMSLANYSYCAVSTNQKTRLLKSQPTAHKLYADLNKSELLPVSPGAKLTNFINSMFNRRRERQATYPSSAADDFEGPDSHVSYTCPSASSSTRSCLVNKSPLSSNDHKPVKKSVRFYSLSVEHSVEIQSRNGEHSGTSTSTKKDENLRFSSMDEYRVASESVTDEDDIDDAASDASSDLFEIDHIIFATINSNNAGTHADELPVFETTNVYGSNGAISRGGIAL